MRPLVPRSKDIRHCCQSGFSVAIRAGIKRKEMPMSHFDKMPLSHMTLLPGEVHLHSAVLVRVTPMKMFGFAGPKAYQLQPLSPRFRAHITDRRLLMEIYPYSRKERAATKLAISGTSMLLGHFDHSPQAHAQIAIQKMMSNAAMRANLAAADDPDAQYAAIPYDILTVTTVSAVVNIGIPYVRLEVSGIKEEMVFAAQLDAQGRLLPKGSIVDNAKAGWGLSREFAQLCQEAISSHRSRPSHGTRLGTPWWASHEQTQISGRPARDLCLGTGNSFRKVLNPGRIRVCRPLPLPSWRACRIRGTCTVSAPAASR